MLVGLTCGPGLRAQEAPTVRVVHVESGLHLDGMPDEPAWLTADSVTDFTQRDPHEGQPISERTVARFVATPQGLWVAFWCYDRQPRGIRRTQLRRDAHLDADDWVGLMLDPQQDRRSGYVFQVNPNGAMADAEILNQEDANDSWNGVWDARARLQPWGWSAELVIPWQALRYREGADTWGVNVGRYIRRTNEEALWRAWRREQGGYFLGDEGLLTGLTDLPSRRRFEGRPFASGTASADTRTYDDAGTDSITVPAAADAKIGFDGKLAVTATLTLDVTVHTDFAQVEVDDQVVNLTRFPVFYPEKREFFLEQSGTFALGREGKTMLFDSRRIGLGPNAEPVQILAGARLTGRLGPERLGVLAVRTGNGEDAVDLVARVQHDVLSRGYLGGMVTYQGGPGIGGTRLGYGLDANVPLVVGGQNLIPAGWVAVTDNGDGTARASAWSAALDFPNDLMDHVVIVSRSEAGFDPALGFVRQEGVTSAFAAFRFFPRPHIRGVRRLRFTALEAEKVWRLDGSPDNASYEVSPFGVEFQTGDEFQITLERAEDHPLEDFKMIPGVTLPAGSYSWDRVGASFESSWGRPVSVDLGFSVGEFYDGTGEEFEYEVEGRFAPHVLAALEGGWSWIRAAGTEFTAQFHRLRLDYATSPRVNTTLFLQWDSESERFAVNARFHWIPKPGSDFYLVWNTTWPTGLAQGIPWRQPLQGALVGKFVWYFRR